jgi:colicin import membrane protein
VVIPDKPPDPTPPDPKPPDPKPPEVKKRPEIAIGPRIVRQVESRPAPSQPRLSAAEIERMLRQGATPGVRNTVSDDEIARCLLLVKRALYAVWHPPSRSEAGNRPAEVELRMGPGGQILGARLVRSSGNPAYDRSALQAADSVGRVEGLTTAFLRRYERLTVAFQLEDL